MEYVERETIIMSTDEFIKREVMDFSKVRLIHPLKGKLGRPMDIGAVAYSDRQLNHNISQKHINSPTLVNLKTFRKERLFCISNIATELIAKKNATVKTTIQAILPIFDWMDLNSHIDFLISVENMHKAYLSYTTYLIERSKTKDHPNPISLRGAKDKQWILRKLINIAFPDQLEEVIGGIITLKGKQDSQEPVSDSYLNEYWDVNFEIFKKFSAQCYSNENFPPYIKTKNINSIYLPIQNDSKVLLLTPYNIDGTKVDFFCYELGDYIKGPTEKFPNKIWQAQKALQRLSKEPRAVIRLILAMYACYAFIQLFRILTRVNNAQLVTLKYSTSFASNRDQISQKFYDVKFRAGDRKVTLRIEKEGYKLFKEYIKLRNWLLDGENCEYLFFSPSSYRTGYPKQLHRQTNYEHHCYLKAKGFLSPSSSALTDQQIRNANTHFLRDLGYISKDVADSNNHSVEVSEAIYSTPPLEKQVDELNDFWAACESSLIHIKDINSEDSQPTTVGSCSTNDKIPITIMKSPPIIPNCKTPQGCLFCIYYVCHADKEDIRKLLSLLFVIKVIIDKTIDFEFADETYNLLIIRIEYILNGISALSGIHEQLVNQLKNEVLNEGVLTDFWNTRLDYYETMGLI